MAPALRFSGYRVLANREYRIFWLGQWVSLVGTWMQQVTQAWLLARLTRSPLALGLLGMASAAPLLLFVLPGGFVSDRFDRYRIVVVTQALSLAQAAILAVLTLSARIEPWHVIALAAALGTINAFDVPARQAFVVELVGPEELPNAIALNSTGFNFARVLGPAIGGLLVAAAGEGTCFALNAASYGAVLFGLWKIRCRRSGRDRENTGRAAGRWWDGVAYSWRHADLRRILVFVGVVSGLSVPYRHFLPSFAQEVLGVGAWRYGLLLSGAGIGAGLGALFLAGIRLSPAVYHRLLPAGLLLLGSGLLGLAWAGRFGAAFVLLVLAGLGGIAYFNASHTLVQLGASDEFRGRVVSVYALMHQGTATFGSLALGLLAEGVGVRSVFYAGAFAALGCGLALLGWRPVSPASSS
ncbi:MAG: MFS transporter [Candidatus Binatia bacterium]|nr:MAG: MFS transporter [Candidatus Binatia bacterium]